LQTLEQAEEINIWVAASARPLSEKKKFLKCRKGQETLAVVLTSSLFIGARTHTYPCRHSTADNMQYVGLYAFDLIAGVFYSRILLLKMAF
jgi:hypothetical protein